MSGEALCIVSAASAGYGRALMQLLRSLQRRRLLPGSPLVRAVVVYDLGLSDAQRRELATRFAWVTLRALDFSAWPEHVARLAHSYAWKPVVIHDAITRGESPLLWLDAATLVHAPPTEVLDELRTSGLYLLRGQTAFGLHCDPLTLQRMGVRLEIRHLPEYAAGVIGLDARRADIRALADQWLALALRPEIICPRDPRLPQHKPEQALLSALVRELEWQGLRAPVTREIDISSARPVRWMSSRHKLPEDAPRWQEPWRHLGQRLYKRLDQLWHRADRFDRRHLGGWRRALREHFTVYLGRGAGSPGQPVAAPWHSYYADPFVVRHRGRLSLLVEEFRYDHGEGRLLALPLDEQLRPGAPELLPSGEGHASFPFVFSDPADSGDAAGTLYLLPETCERRSIDVYGFDDFPRGARLLLRLMHDIDAADTVLLPHGGRWWLITAVRDARSPNRWLAIFHAPHWRTTDWTAHPVNAERRHGGQAHSFGRCAGAAVWHDGAWLRPIHASERFYGEKIAWRRITRLDEHGFDEQPCEPPPGLRGIASGRSLHHISQAGDVWACDSRDRTPRGVAR